MYYSIVLDKRPAVLLLAKDRNWEMKYVHRCPVMCAKLEIRLYTEDAEED